MAIVRSTASAFPIGTIATGQVTTGTVTLGPAGDLVLLEVFIGTSTVTVSSVTNSNSALTWTRIGAYNDTNVSYRREIWSAEVTPAAAGQSCTITITPSASVATNAVRLQVDELTAGLGVNTIWTATVFTGQTNASSTTVTYPSLTSTAAATCVYYGWSTTASQAYSGGTSPINSVVVTYTQDTTPEQLALSATLAYSTAYQPLGSFATAAVHVTVGCIITASVIPTNPPRSNVAVMRASFR